MYNVVTSKILVAYSQCPRKAFYLLYTEEKGVTHEYMQVFEQCKGHNRSNYLWTLNVSEQPAVEISSTLACTLHNEGDFVVKATLMAGNLEAYCDVLIKVKSHSSSGGSDYEPTIVVGTYSISKEQELELLFTGFVIGQIYKKPPFSGYLVKMDGKVARMKLEPHYKELKRYLDPLREWLKDAPSAPPSVIINKHCPVCQFKMLCAYQAEKTDDLSLLDRITPKLIQRYQKKGIFTVSQLSYTFRPRRSKKRTKKRIPVHKLELQALAIRTNKIYIQELPSLQRHPVELFLDIEGIPDQHRYYLIGLAVSQKGHYTYYSFWGDTVQDEEEMWRRFIDKIKEYQDAPIYHYGAYEPTALEKLAARYQTDCEHIRQNLVNIITCIYGKIYFPVRSNSLKDIGRFVGASWTSPEASGLQTLVWRHHWEKTCNATYKQLLLTYNQEDCRALFVITDELTRIAATAQTQPNIDFADNPKQLATSIGEQIHNRFEAILKSAHADYEGKKIVLSHKNTGEHPTNKKNGGVAGHKGYKQYIPRVTKIIRVPQRISCPKCGDKQLRASKKMVEQIIIEIVPSKNGYRKTIIKYCGIAGFCQTCRRYYYPDKISKLKHRKAPLFGHGFKAWVLYQRLVLRLSYRIIVKAIEEQFSEKVSLGSIPVFIKSFACYYADTEGLLIKHILASPFIHADETQINIQGVNHYVWVFTDGRHVVFKMTETREAAIVHNLLTDYKGILVSDFYPGYDSVKCRQQKCLVHLIRDLNEDLWKSPFDHEFETFVLEIKNLLVPLLETTQTYGLRKKRDFQKFHKQIEQFYSQVITDCIYRSDLASRYQTRFKRYRDSLFTFIDYNDIPWNNNMAERSIRHLAIQRKISGSFSKSGAPDYLLMLGIAQTCRFQNKSLLKFLMSREKDVDSFKVTKSIKILESLDLD